MDVGLAVRDDDHFVAAQLAVQDAAQRLGSPRHLILVAGAMLDSELVDQRAEIARDRSQLGTLALGLPGGAQQALAAHQRPQSLHPAAPGELRDYDRNEGDGHAEAQEEVEDVLARLLAAARDEAHVVHEHEIAERRRSAPDGPYRDEDGTLGTRDEVPVAAGVTLQVGAGDVPGQVVGRNRFRGRRRTEADGEEALVLSDAREVLQQALAVAALHQILDAILDRVGHEGGANVEIAHEPPQGQLVHERDHGVAEGGQRQEQGDHEPQR